MARGHIMRLFNLNKVPFTGLHCTPESDPGFMLEFQPTQREIGRKKIDRNSGGSNIFLKVTL